MSPHHRIVAAFVLANFLLTRCPVNGHGRLVEPPARNTLWRFGFKAQANYNDNELFCGGIGVTHTNDLHKFKNEIPTNAQGITRNEGRCGACGDPYDGPRLHETGNQMARNETVRNYFPGSSIDLMIDIVANHGGQFNFEICWRDSLDVVETEDCFESLRLTGNNINLEDADETTGLSYELDAAKGTGLYTMSVDLPLNRTCEHCVFRWHWRSANNWGACEDGTEAIGCGYQEIYRNCADISVKRSGAAVALRGHSTATP